MTQAVDIIFQKLSLSSVFINKEIVYKIETSLKPVSQNVRIVLL